ncbi:hypothetical protein N182_32950 [Sinorhizobium sp. GL2]|nr:hypothetical protein N182_32950 [Sinorhizobium sp. GL2]
MRQRLHPLAKVMVIAAPGFVTDHHPAKADGFTRPPDERQLSALLRASPLRSLIWW